MLSPAHGHRREEVGLGSQAGAEGRTRPTGTASTPLVQRGWRRGGRHGAHGGLAGQHQSLDGGWTLSLQAHTHRGKAGWPQWPAGRKPHAAPRVMARRSPHPCEACLRSRRPAAECHRRKEAGHVRDECAIVRLVAAACPFTRPAGHRRTTLTPSRRSAGRRHQVLDPGREEPDPSSGAPDLAPLSRRRPSKLQGKAATSGGGKGRLGEEGRGMEAAAGRAVAIASRRAAATDRGLAGAGPSGGGRCHPPSRRGDDAGGRSFPWPDI